MGQLYPYCNWYNNYSGNGLACCLLSINESLYKKYLDCQCVYSYKGTLFFISNISAMKRDTNLKLSLKVTINKFYLFLC